MPQENLRTTRPTRAWACLLWATYALLGFAAGLALEGEGSSVSSEADALVAMSLGVLLLVFVPYRWARSRTANGRDALRMLGWDWIPKSVPLGVATGILLFAALSSAGPKDGGFPWAVAALYGVVAACCEELFFRGHLRQRIGAWQIPAFAVLHGASGLTGITVALLAGIVLTILVRHGLAASIAAHAIFNLLAVLHGA